jgi:hypothetical protein
LAILSKILPLFIIISFQRSSDWKVIDWTKNIFFHSKKRRYGHYFIELRQFSAGKMAMISKIKIIVIFGVK